MKRSNATRRIISFTTIIAVILSLLVFVPPQASYASDIVSVPTAVFGRVLATNRSGDSSEWVEIARNGGYSLIVRKDPLQSSGFGSSAQYSNSTVRNIVNSWFNNSLSSGARLRDFTVQNNALSAVGSWTSTSSGYSRPTTTSARTGNDVAFLLSFAEAAMFCSTQYAPSSTSYVLSSSEATSNFNKLPHISGPQPTNHWWLRSGGGLSDRACTVGLGGFNSWGTSAMNGAVNQYQVSSNIIKVRPALWVGSGIFENQYQVTYNPNGGSGQIVNLTVNANSTHTVSNQGYSWTGRTLTSFNTAANGSGTRYNIGQSFTVTGNITLFAQWTEVTYRISYNPNGGMGSVVNYDLREYTVHYVEDRGYTRDGYNFKGYNTASNGSGTQYSVGQAIYVLGNMTLYAQWEEKPIVVYSITYHPNTGTGAVTIYDFIVENTVHYVQNQGYTKDGYNFIGYNTASNGSGTHYNIGQSFIVTRNMTLYAQWEEKPIVTYRITYHPNGGNGNIVNVDVPAGTPYAIMSQGYTRDDYNFSGYNTATNGTGVHYNVGQTIIVTGNLTLNAQWTYVPVVYATITYISITENFTKFEVITDRHDVSKPYTFKDMGFDRYNIMLNGYNTDLYGYGTFYSLGQTINLTGDLILYAQWQRIM